MAIFVEDEQPFEAGTTISSKMRITDREGDFTAADEVDGEDKVTLEVIHSNSGEVVREEKSMDRFSDENDDAFYIDTWTTSEDQKLGQYYLVHRATVGDDPFKMTRIIELVDAKDK